MKLLLTISLLIAALCVVAWATTQTIVLRPGDTLVVNVPATSQPATQPTTSPATQPTTGPVVVVPTPPKFPAIVNTGEFLKASDVFVTQGPKSYGVRVLGGSVDLTNYGVNQGGMIESLAADSIRLVNVYNVTKPTGGSGEAGSYNAMIWTSPPRTFLWDNSGLRAYLRSKGMPESLAVVKQGSAESAVRMKLNEGKIIGVEFQGLGANAKPVFVVRHVTTLAQIINCTFNNGLIEIGQQKIGKAYDTTQHVKQISFENCKFSVWVSGRKYVVRSPGVERIVYSNCVDADNKTFSAIE